MLRISPSHLSTELKLKLKMSLATMRMKKGKQRNTQTKFGKDGQTYRWAQCTMTEVHVEMVMAQQKSNSMREFEKTLSCFKQNKTSQTYP